MRQVPWLRFFMKLSHILQGCLSLCKPLCKELCRPVHLQSDSPNTVAIAWYHIGFPSNTEWLESNTELLPKHFNFIDACNHVFLFLVFSSSVKGSAVPSPLSADSGGAEQTGSAAGKHSVRGKALAAQAAITCKYGSSNVIANARNWGVEIVQLEDMLKRLECYGSVEKRLASKPLVSGRVAKQGTKPKVRKLYAPFIKVEDHSRCYKPLVHELKEWPKIYFDGPLGSCPFDSPKNNADNHHGEHNRMKRYICYFILFNILIHISSIVLYWYVVLL